MRGISIVSKSNNHYFYNDETGFIEAIKDNLSSENNLGEIENETNNKITIATPEDIKEHLFDGNGFKQMILEVTQNCNMACKYCCFNEHYQNSRPPSNTYMTYETGKKAIDYYMRLFEDKTYSNPYKKPSIGFYGGEPLLNFSLIKELTEYMHTAYSQYEFEHNITTNALLLDDEVCDFLAKYDFSILISLDGNKENHDRNRVKLNGEGTFDIVMKHVNRFKEKYPNYMKLSFSTCYDYRTDLYELKKFVEENDLFIASMSMISNIESDYYDDFTEEEKNKFNAQYNKLHDEFIEQCMSSIDNEQTLSGDISMPLFCKNYFDLNFHSLLTTPPRKCLPYTGSCIPGEKLFISSLGEIHTCERITNKFPIGNVDTGLDFKKIADIVNTFNSYEEKCKKCDISRLCGICYSRATCGDKLIINPELCENRLNDCKSLFENFVSVMEVNPEKFDKLNANYLVEMTIKTNGTLF